MKNGKRSAKAKPITVSYGRSKVGGRPPSPATMARLAQPACEKCRNLHFSARLKPYCAHGLDLNAATCEKFDDVSKNRVAIYGGITGFTKEE